MVIVNAWNEWSECGYLEPDMDHGHAYLDATRRAIEAVRGPLRPAPAATWSDADADAGADPGLRTAALLGRLDALERSYAALLGEHEAWKAMQPRLVADAVAEAEARRRARAPPSKPNAPPSPTAPERRSTTRPHQAVAAPGTRTSGAHNGTPLVSTGVWDRRPSLADDRFWKEWIVVRRSVGPRPSRVTGGGW